MKKIYLFACAIMSVVGASAQLKHNPNAFGRQSSRGESANTQQQYELPADRVTIYSNDFSNCSDWTIQNAFDEGFTDFITGIDFECTTDGPSGPAAIDPIASTSAANGFMMVDSDVFGGSTGGTWVENCWFQSAQPINLSAYDNVSLKFQSFYRMWDNGSSDGSEYCLVELSTDGVTWPDVTTYEVSEAAPGTRFELWPTMETQDPVNNPSTFVFNITDYAAQQDSIYLRFRWKGTWGYAWMVDDIEIFETFANDLNVNKVYNGDIINDYEYTAIPTSQMSDLVVGAIVANYGFNDQNAIATNMSISGTNGDITYTYLAGTIDTIWSTPINIGNTVGTYTATVTVPSDDENTFNTLSKDFKITQDWYSHCSDAPAAQRGWDIDDPIAVGATFTMNADAQAGGIQVWLGPNTTTDVVCQAVLYLVGADIQDLEVVGYSNEFNVPASMIDNDYVTVGFTGSGPVDVIAGAQYVVEILKTEENSDRLYVLADVLDEDFGTVNYGPFGTSDAVNHFVGYSWSPALRLVLDPNIAVAPVASNNASLVVNAYPNPTNGITTVKYASASNTIAQLTVRDITGRVVLTQQNPNLAQGQFSFDAATMAPGAYTYSVNAGTEVVTGELIVR
jgi:Secretion system C-terminal sorting domain